VKTLTIALSVAVAALALIEAIPRVAPTILLIGTVGSLVPSSM